VKLIILSDHTLDRLIALENDRTLEFNNASERYASLKQLHDRRQTLETTWRDSWHNRWIAKTVYYWWKWKRTQPVVLPDEPRKAEPTQQESILHGGISGESRLKARLLNALSDEWTALMGYRQQMGEVDIILVGPSGIVSVEVKNYRGAIHCIGDSFTRIRENGEITVMSDRNGRSPSMQVNEAADHLEAAIGIGSIARAVVLVNKHAEIRTADAITVDYVGKIENFDPVTLSEQRSIRLAANQVEWVIARIAAEHAAYDAWWQRQQRTHNHYIARPQRKRMSGCAIALITYAGVCCLAWLLLSRYVELHPKGTGGSQTPHGIGQGSTTSLRADKTVLSVGQSAELSWAAPGCRQLTMSEKGLNQPWNSLLERLRHENGTLKVKPRETTTYSLHGSTTDGKACDAVVTITVTTRNAAH